MQPLIAKQLRRTVAPFIANQPFGIVAGSLQFGHIREVTMQGYAGDPEAGFIEELEHARSKGQIEEILELYDDVMAGAQLGGRAAPSLEAEFKRMIRELGPEPRIANRLELAKMLRNKARDLHAGVINDCFFNESTALCLVGKRKKGASVAPILALCDQENCPNACWSKKHVPMIDLALREVDAHRKTRRLSKNQRTVLDSSAAKYKRMKKAIKQ